MRSKRKTLISVIVCLVVVLAILMGVVAVLFSTDLFGTESTGHTQSQTTLPTPTQTTSTTQSTTSQTELPTTESTAPPVYKLGTATIAAVGDVLMHMPVVNTAQVTDGNYDFANIFTYFRDYVGAVDYAVANLETTLAGHDHLNNDGTVGYHGQYEFNSPDGIVSSLQAAGFDMLLTANNHSYDTRAKGFYRTQQIIQSFGLDHLGTVDSLQMPLWQVREINGIRIGMICYTYDTNEDPEKVALNGIPMSSETAALIGTFSYSQLDIFYEQVQAQIAEMEAAGAEAVMLYIHWGEEYKTQQNSTQSAMAQKLCDLGVDVIVGGHPHVVQPVELLTSTTDENHKTVCIYSLGNIVSNQRIEHMKLKTGHTEDGAFFSVTFAKYSDGTVILEAVSVLPTWVDLHYNRETGKNVYSILPLDGNVADWQTAFQLSDSRYEQALASYDRTMAIVGEGLESVNGYLTWLVADTEARLGINE